jgi:hypothetical protein
LPAATYDLVASDSEAEIQRIYSKTRAQVEYLIWRSAATIAFETVAAAPAGHLPLPPLPSSSTFSANLGQYRSKSLTYEFVIIAIAYEATSGRKEVRVALHSRRCGIRSLAKICDDASRISEREYKGSQFWG